MIEIAILVYVLGMLAGGALLTLGAIGRTMVRVLQERRARRRFARDLDRWIAEMDLG
jgi:hypothetical protein